jgi:Zn finger protein HypA/HybF involved in hydrogenase expression
MKLHQIFLTLLLLLSTAAFAVGELTVMPGEVIEGHIKLEAECKECHVRFDKAAQTKLCMNCHKSMKDFMAD